MMKNIYRTIILTGVMSLPILVSQAANAATLSDSDIANMSMLDKFRAQLYFKSHSFDFPKIFSLYHPGPYWILKKKSDFKLTDEQLKQEEELKLGMAKNTIEDEAVLKQAYVTYTADSAKSDTSSAQIKSDIEAIGKAQTSLATEMVDYHLQSFELLTPEQRKTYHDLVTERTK
ncbi:MAG: hypothetical protein ACYC0M_09660 [Burkholderiales bacterium]